MFTQVLGTNVDRLAVTTWCYNVPESKRVALTPWIVYEDS